MLHIKIYGTGTAGFEMVKTKIREYLVAAQVDFELQEETNVNNFIKESVQSVPAVRINGEDLIEIDSNGGFNQTLRNAVQEIMRKVNYGNMTKIIVPTDFSEPSFNAYNYANGLAKDLGGVIVLTHVYFPSSADLNEFTIPNNDLENVHRKKLQELVKSVNQDWIGEIMHEPMVESDFRIGFPKTELTELSEQKNVMMVMGSTGEGDAFKKVFGSLSTDMIKSAKCPLFIIPPGATYQTPKSVVFASGSVKTDSNNIFDTAKMCSKFGADLKVLHVHTGENEYDEQAVHEMLKANFPVLNFDIRIIRAEKILDGLALCLKETDHDIVAFTKVHRNFLAELFHESISEHFALYSKKPLLIFPST
ncbi:MAG: universal stress protein [Saprospiraceae bacterium]|nr:universal stress protein [Saprospiraceae bacterium]